MTNQTTALDRNFGITKKTPLTLQALAMEELMTSLNLDRWLVRHTIDELKTIAKLFRVMPEYHIKDLTFSHRYDQEDDDTDVDVRINFKPSLAWDTPILNQAYALIDQVNTAYEEEYDFYPEPIEIECHCSPLFAIVASTCDYWCDMDVAAWRRILLFRAGIELNPGPASVDFINLASRNIKLFNQTIQIYAIEDDGKLKWFTQILINHYPSLSSSMHSHYNKKMAMEMCYVQIMAKINAKNENGCFDLEDEMKQAFVKRTRTTQAIDAMIVARHQSESATEGAHGEETAEVMSALQTNLVTTTDDSTGTPTTVEVGQQMRTTTEDIGKYENLTGQWYLIDEFDWTTSSPVLLREYVLPRDILAANEAANSPPLIPFNVNYLWRGALEVKVQTKAQMFLTGQLQISSFYELDADADSNMRRNIYSASQTNHVLVNAGGSNDATLHIPFVYRQPFIQVKQDNMDLGNRSCLNMVNVLLQVINPLKIGTGSSDVSIAVFVRFVESEFNGKRDGSFGNFTPLPPTSMNFGDAHHQMEFASLIGPGIKLAERLLFSKKKDKNRDNPPITGPTDMLVPYSAQSFAHGTDVAEPVRTLRLNPTGQTPHPDSLESIQTMAQIAQTFGLFRQIVWNEGMAAGTTLLKVPCTPLMGANHYMLSTTDPDNQLRFVPPIGVVASMYNLYRGPLAFRLDMIANKFYLGGLIMGYVPGIREDTVVTNAMLRNSAFTTYSLDANNLSITYETPFINAAEWYNTPFRKPFDAAYHRYPGVFVINVLQRLQQPENVNGEIDINVYMAGSSGFECANLTQPELVVPMDAQYVVEPFTIFSPKNFPPPDFLAMVPDTSSGWAPLNPYVALLGGTTGTRALFSIPSTLNSFIGYSATPIQFGPNLFNYFLMLKVNGNIQMYLIKQDMQSMIELQNALNGIPYVDSDLARTTLAAEAPDSWFAPGGGGTTGTFPQIRAIWSQGDEVTIAATHQSERDQAPNVVSSVQHHTVNGWGTETYGENFGNVVDLLRRPVYIEDFTYVDSPSNKFPNALFKIRVTPDPPPIDISDPFDLFNRSSHTKLILSGYRYYRGSMRHRVVMPKLSGVYVWAQYNAADKIPTYSQAFPMSDVRTPIQSHSNPIDLLTLDVNQIMNLEIPWYNSNQLNYLQRLDFSQLDNDQINATALGTLTVGLSTNSSEVIPGTYTINVYSKVGDDFSPYVFQGFPPMAFQTYLNPTQPGILAPGIVAEHQMFKTTVSNTVRSNIIEPIVTEVEKEISSVATTVRAQIGDVTTVIGEALNEVVQKIKKSAAINLDFNVNTVITDLVSQLGHCIMNPTLKTFIWAIITMLTKIGILSYNVIGKAVELFNNICTCIFGIKDKLTSKGTQQEPAPGVTAEHQMPSFSPSQTLPQPIDDVLINNTAEFWSLIVASLAGLIGFTASAKYFSARDFAWTLSRSLREFTMTANGLTSFLKLHLDTIKKVISSMCFWKSVEEHDPESMIVYNKSFIETWCKEVSYLCSPGMEVKIIGDSYLSDRVYLAFMIGEVISKNVISKTENKTNNAILSRKLADIRKMHEQCMMAGKTGAVRRETFGLWICDDGEAGIGKSFLVEELTTRLILKGDIQFEGEKTLTLNAADKYWSRCKKQPVLWIDDVFQVQTEEMLQAHLNAIFSVMSPTPLCPPMADLKNKDDIYEPRFLVCTSNVAYPNVKPITSKPALWRRRHILMKARLDQEHCRRHHPDWTPRMEVKDMSAECLADYQHLWFSFALHPKDRNSAWTAPMKWAQAVEYVERVYERFEEQSLRSYNHRLNQYYAAKRQILPDYINQMPNIPKHSNLFEQIKELAEKLDASTLSVDEIHWRELMEAKREKWIDQVYNVPKRMMAMLVGRYPMITYGVNSILTGNFPSRKGYEAYTAHGLGWNNPKHAQLCPSNVNPPLITNAPMNSHGRRELGYNPFSSHYRNIVRQTHKMDCYGLDNEAVTAQVASAMLKDDVQAFADELQTTMFDMDRHYEEELDVFDASDLFTATHNAEDEVADLIKKIGNYIRDKYLGQRDKLMSILTCVTGLRKTLTEEEILEMLEWYYVSLVRSEEGHRNLTSEDFAMLVYTKIAQYDTKCIHYRLDKYHVYMKSSNTFVNSRTKSSISAGECNVNCALKNRTMFDHILHMVRCPEGMPSNATYGFDMELEKLTIENLDSFKDRCIAKLKSWCYTLYVCFCEHYKSIIATMAITVVAWYAWFKPEKEPEPENQGTAYDKNKKMQENRKVVHKRKLITHNANKEKIVVGEHQAGQNTSDIIRKVNQNIVFIRLYYTYEGIAKTKKFRCIMLRERQCLMIRHYIEEIQYYADHGQATKIVLMCNGMNEVPLPLECVNEFSVLENQDESNFDPDRPGTGYVLYNGLCVVELPKTVKQFPSITKHFISTKDEQRMSSNGILLMSEPGKGSLCNEIVARQVRFTSYEGLTIANTDTTSALVLERVWTYPGCQGGGLCGSVLINEDCGKIIGVHTAGAENINCGFSERLVYEEWEFVDESAKMEVFQPILEPITLNDHTLEGAVFPLGKVPMVYAQQNSGETQIRRSVIHGVVPVKTEPAPLTPYDPRLPPGSSPLYDGVAVHGMPPKEFPADVVAEAQKDLSDLLIAKCIPVRPVQIMSVQEAICGNPLIGLDSIPLDTSEGFPLNKMRPKGCKGKGWLFNIQRDKYSNVTKLEIHPELQKIMDVKDAMRKRGIKPFTVFADVLKDETLPHAKCRKKAGTRIISMSPVDFTIQSRQVFGDFILAHGKHRGHLEHAIGVNTYSEEWTHLHVAAMRKGNKIVAGDHSKFGPRMQTIVADAVFKCIREWYAFHGATEEHLRLIDIMAAELTNSVHLVFNILYQVMCGIVSGSLFTAPFNSLGNSLYFRIAWRLITNRTFMEYYQHMYVLTYGDDNMNSVSDEIADEFNVATLNKFFAQYDMSYTDVHKNVGDDMIKYCTIEETSFLKTGWKKHPLKQGYFLPTLEKDSIENQLNWISKEGDAVENTKVNCKNALRQAFGHGREYYEQLATKIKHAFARQGHHYIAKTWDEQYMDIEGDFFLIH